MKDYFYSIDVGGTEIKGGIVASNGEILFSAKTKTNISSPNMLASNIIILIKSIEKQSGLSVKNAKGLGIGVPGLVDSKNGILRFSGNLKLKDYPLLGELKKQFQIPIKIANDAELACLAEKNYGEGKFHKNFVLLTIGTGIGGGIVANGISLRENQNYACEIGHMKVTDKKIKCTCGEFGCFEAIASTKALISLTKKFMKQNPNSKIWECGGLKNVDGRTVFEYADFDETAKQVFQKYIELLGDGIVSLVNIFDPEVVILGGAISNQKERLTLPLETYVNKHVFKAKINQKIKIKTAKITGNSGILGAKCLFD